MHLHNDAVSICKNCGKAMCVNCSAYTGHSSLCTVCLKIIQENELRGRINVRTSAQNGRIAGASSKIEALTQRINYLQGEINKINWVLSQGVPRI